MTRRSPTKPPLFSTETRTLMMKFYQLKTLGNANNDDIIFIDDYVKGLEMEDWRVGNGEAVASTWPVDAAIHLRKSSGRKITDIVGTVTNTLFISHRARDILEKFVPKGSVEFLPVTIYDHRKRVVSQDHLIANPLGALDCLDLSASELLWHPEKPDEIISVEKPVLSAEKLQKAPPLFRIQHASVRHVVNYDVAKALLDAKVTNLYWDKLEVK